MSQGVGRGRGRGRGKKPTSPAAIPAPIPAAIPAPIPAPAASGISDSSETPVPSLNTLTLNPTPPPPKTTPRNIGRGRGKKPTPQQQEDPPASTPSPAPTSPQRYNDSSSSSPNRNNSPRPNQGSNAIAPARPRYDPDGKIINPHSKRKQLEPLKRKDYGTVGKEIKLYSNFYEVQHTSNMIIYQYDVQFEVSEKILKQNKSMALDIFNKMVSEYRDNYFSEVYPVFDGGHIMYTNKKISNLQKMVRLPITYEFNATRQDCINITVSPTSNEIKFSDVQDLYSKETDALPYNLFSCADIILGFMPKMSYVSFGRNYFPRGQQVHSLGSGIELWSGSVMAVKPGQWKLLVNVDEKHTAFYKTQNLRDFVNSMYPNKNTFQRHEVKKLEGHLKGLQITTEHLGYRRKYRICGIQEEAASKHQITDNATGQKKTIADYFREKNVILNYPNLPCVQVEPKNRKIFIPLELGTIVEGQRCIRALTERQVADIIRASAKRPDVKKRNTDNSANRLFESSQDFAQHYGMKISRTPLKIKGRVLAAPNLKYNNASERPRGGVWRSKRLKESRSLDCWGIISMAPKNRIKLEEFTNILRKEGTNIGIRVNNPAAFRFVLEKDFEQELAQMIMRTPNLNYIFVILPQPTNNNIYSKVKEAEVAHGIITQCIKLETVEKRFKPQTVGNVLLKTNTKLGGTNWEVDDFSPITSNIGNTVFAEPVMIVGADVTHWAKGDGNKPSIAGVVCTLDNKCSQYASRIQLQQIRTNRASDEIIRNFKDIMMDLLKTYRHATGRRPGKILYYRDGVSQGQFIQTLTEEIAGIQAACKELEEDFQPKITYINAQKRHHTRLYCGDPQDADRSGNVPPGTVVDREITNPIHFDFYLNSHSGIQGTNRPCHYTVLWDDSDMSPDLIQLLTYYLCHTYARCSRTVSYPAPTYYAHLLCARARTMLSAMKIDWYANNKPSLPEIERKLTQHSGLQNVTYFI